MTTHASSHQHGAPHDKASIPFKAIVGGHDDAQRPIDQIYTSGDDYVVYGTKGALAFSGDTDFLYEPGIMSRINRAMRFVRIRDEPTRENTYSQIGVAADLCKKKQSDEARLILTDLAESLERACVARGRLEYLGGALIMCLVLWGIQWVCAQYAFIPEWTQAAAFGSTGALFSVLLGQATVPVDLERTTAQNWVAGGSRTLIGILSAAIVLLAIKAKIFLDPFISGHADVQNYVNWFLAFLSGFSETLVPNLLRENEGKAWSPKKRPAPEKAAPGHHRAAQSVGQHPGSVAGSK